MSLNSSSNNNNNNSSNARYYQQYGGGLVGGNPYQSGGFGSGNTYQSYPLHYHSGIQPPQSSSSIQHPHATIPNSPLNNHMIGQQQRNNFRTGYQLPLPPSSSIIQGVSQPNNGSNIANSNAIKNGPVKRKSEMELISSVENGSQIIKKIKTEGSAVEISSLMVPESLHPVEPSLTVYDFSGSAVSKELDEKLASTHALLEEQPRIKPNYMALTSSEATRLQVDFFPSKFMTEGFINELKKDLFEDPNAFKRCTQGSGEQRRVFCMIDDLNKIMNVLKLDREMTKRKEQAEKDLNKSEKEQRESNKRETSQTAQQRKNMSQRRSSSDSDNGQEDSQSESDEVVSHSYSSRDTSAKGKIQNKKKNTKTLLRKSSKRLKRGGQDDDEDEESNVYNSYQENDDDAEDQNDNDEEENEDSAMEEKRFIEMDEDNANEESYSQNRAKKLIVRKKKETKKNSNISNTNTADGGDGSGLAFRKANRQKFLRIDDDDEKQEKSTVTITEKVDQEQQQQKTLESSKNADDTNSYASVNGNTYNTSQNIPQSASLHAINSASQMEIESDVKIENRLLKFKERENQLANREADFEKRQKMIMEKQQKIMYLHIAFTQAAAEHENAARNLEIVNNHFQLP